MGNQMYGRFWELLSFPPVCVCIPKSLNIEKQINFSGKERELVSHLDFIVEYMFLLAQ